MNARRTPPLRVGDRFGNTIIARTFKYRNIPHAECFCLSCYLKIFTVPQTKLRTGKTKACHRCGLKAGHARQIRLTPKEKQLRDQEGQYRYSAFKRGYVWALDRETFRKVYKGDCTYCGLSPSNGVDRRDNSKGYTAENSVSCCKLCNYAKRDHSEQVFAAWIDRLKRYSK